MQIIEKTKLTKIGNSQGFRISKNIVEKLNIKLNEEREILVNEKGEIVIRDSKKPREGWEEKFINAGSLDDKELLMPDVFEDEYFEDWTW